MSAKNALIYRCVHFGLIDESKGPRFFGASRMICVIRASRGVTSPLLLLSKTTARSKKAIGDASLMVSLGMDATKLRDMVQAAEALVANWTTRTAEAWIVILERWARICFCRIA